MFPVGEPNDAYAQYFSGKSWLAPLTAEQVPTANVTFEPGCRNNWHVHNADKGGGQMLICVGGRGYYQEWGQPAQEMLPGDVVNIPTGVKHCMARHPTAGSHTWRSPCQARIARTNGSSPSPTRSMAN